jgi:hypothetical protein
MDDPSPPCGILGGSSPLSSPLLVPRFSSAPPGPVGPSVSLPILAASASVPSRQSVSPLAERLLALASGAAASPLDAREGLFVTPGPPSPPPLSGKAAGAAQLTPWEQAIDSGGPAPSAKRQRTFDLMRVVEETGVEHPHGSACSLCAGTGARCFISAVASTRKCSWCLYKAHPCSLVSFPCPLVIRG